MLKKLAWYGWSDSNRHSRGTGFWIRRVYQFRHTREPREALYNWDIFKRLHAFYSFCLNYALGVCDYRGLMQGKLKFLDDWYEKTKALARHKRATPTLCALSFVESSFFPIPVDVMLIPMVQAAPKRWWKLALLSTIFSVLGGILGYMIGLFFFETLAQPILCLLYTSPSPRD